MRTRASLAASAMLSGAFGAANGAAAVPPDEVVPKVRTHVRFADGCDDECDAETDESERDQAEYVLFDDEDDNGDPGGDDDDKKQRDGESGRLISRGCVWA